MSLYKTDEGFSSTADPARDFLEFWKNYFEQTAIQTKILFETMQGGKPLDQLQNQALASLSQNLDDFMRTPAFLEVLKQSLKRMVELKKMQDQMSQAVSEQTGLPLTADVRGVFERVNSAEQTIMKQLAMLDDRLKAIEKLLSSGPTEKQQKRKRATTRDSGDDAPSDPAD